MSNSQSNGYAVLLAVGAMVVAAALVAGTVAFTEVDNPLDDGSPADAREFSLSLDDGTAVLTFEGGERVEAGSSLLVRVEGAGTWTWAELDADVAANDPVTAGEFVAVTAAEPGDSVTVTWRNGAGASRVVAEWTVGEQG